MDASLFILDSCATCVTTGIPSPLLLRGLMPFQVGAVASTTLGVWFYHILHFGVSNQEKSIKTCESSLFLLGVGIKTLTLQRYNSLNAHNYGKTYQRDTNSLW